MQAFLQQSLLRQKRNPRRNNNCASPCLLFTRRRNWSPECHALLSIGRLLTAVLCASTVPVPCLLTSLMYTQEDQRADYAAKARASWLSPEALSKRDLTSKAPPANEEGRKGQHPQPQDSDDDTSVRALARRERQRLAGESANAIFISKTPERAPVASPWGWRTTTSDAVPTESRTPKTPTVVMLIEEDARVTRANSR